MGIRYIPNYEQTIAYQYRVLEYRKRVVPGRLVLFPF